MILDFVRHPLRIGQGADTGQSHGRILTPRIPGKFFKSFGLLFPGSVTRMCGAPNCLKQFIQISVGDSFRAG